MCPAKCPDQDRYTLTWEGLDRQMNSPERPWLFPAVTVTGPAVLGSVGHARRRTEQYL